MEISCDNCGKKIVIDEELYNSGQSQVVRCQCGFEKHVYKTNDWLDTACDVLKTAGKLTFKLLKFAYNKGMEYAEEYQQTEEALEKRGLSSWDEEKLQEEYRKARNLADSKRQKIIAEKLKEKIEERKLKEAESLEKS